MLAGRSEELPRYSNEVLCDGTTCIAAGSDVQAVIEEGRISEGDEAVE
jgi:hypothetical protein